MFDNQVPNGKLVKKYVVLVKLAQYFVCEGDKKLVSYFKARNLSFKTWKSVFTNISFRH